MLIIIKSSKRVYLIVRKTFNADNVGGIKDEHTVWVCSIKKERNRKQHGPTLENRWFTYNLCSVEPRKGSQNQRKQPL